MRGERPDGVRRRKIESGRARPRVRVVVIGSDPLFLELLKEWLGRLPGIRVVGEASDGGSGARLIDSLSPEVAVWHLCGVGRGTDGIDELASAAGGKGWRTRLIGILCCREARGRSGPRSGPGIALVSSDKGTRGLLRALEEALPERRVFAGQALTARQRRVLKMVALGWTSKRIARELGLSRRTVDTHRANIMKRLGVNSVAEMVGEALRRGLIG